MRLYLDDDLAGPVLAHVLRKDSHDVQIPADVGLSGANDSVHLAHAINGDRVCLTRDYGDFQDLHDLLMVGKGHHRGILLIRRDNDPHRNLSPHDIARARRKLEAAGVPLVLEQAKVGGSSRHS